MKFRCILLLIGLISQLTVFPQINFLPPVTYPTGYPYDLANGDFNNDGKQDIAVMDYYNNRFDVYLNTGTGGNFAPKVSYGPIDGTVAYSIASADFNDDGYADLIFSGYTNVVIFPGSASGTFGTKTTITPGSTFNQKITVNDFNSDGRADFAITNAMNSNILVYRRTGAMTFAAPVTYTALAAQASIASGDINGDGKVDLILSNTFNSSISILTNTGSGAFGARYELPVNSNPDIAIIGDINGDTYSDIVVPNSSYLCVFWSTGPGTFTAADCYGTPTNCNDAVFMDYNLDGKKDVVSANFTGSSLTFFQGTGATGFFSKTNLPSANGQSHIVTADFNLDGKADIATNNYLTSTLGVYFNGLIKVATATVTSMTGISAITASGGTLQMTVAYSPSNANLNTLVGWAVSPTSLAGINSSGLLTATSLNNGTVTVTATFGSVVASRVVYISGQQPIITSFSPQLVFPNQPIVINGTGFNSNPSLNTVWINKVACQVLAGNSVQLTVLPPKIGLAKSKIEVLNESTRLLGTSMDDVIPVFFGNSSLGISDLGSPVTLSGGQLNFTATGDMDGDGMADIVSLSSNVLNIQRNNGTVGTILGSSFTRTSIVLSYSVNSLELADMDMDGKLDILCTNSSNGNIHIMKNLSSPGTITASSFGAVVTIPGNASNKLVAGDLNNDGKLDLISIESGVGVIVFPNVGPVGTITSSSFGTPFIINNGITTVDFKVEDLDRDGFLDIAVVNGNYLILIRNNGILNTLTISNFSVAGSTLGDPGCFCDLELDDFDGDKKVDVLFGSQNPRFNFFQNNSTLGNISTTNFLPRSILTTNMAHYPSLLDLNGDTKTDLFQIDAFSDFIYGYQNLNPTGTLNGTNFSTSFIKSVVLPNFNYYNYSNHDVDGDGRVDMVAQLNNSSNTIGLTIFQNLNTFSFSPNSGPFGTPVTINGTNLSSASGVSFNGSPASFTVLNSTMLVATVPSFAGSGPVQVYNTYYTSTGANFTFLQLNQSITGFNVLLPATLGSGYTISGVSATSGLTVTFSGGNVSVATVSGNGIVSLYGAGTITITAFQAGNANYFAASPITQVLTVNKATQTITGFNPLSAINLGSAPLTISGVSATSGLTVTFAGSNALVATVSPNGVVSAIGAGTVTITAFQGGNNLYSSATPVQQVLTIICPTTQILTQPTSATVCSGIVQTFFVSTTGLGLSYAWSNGQTGQTMSTSIAGTNYTVTVSGVCGNAISTPVGLTVNPITQILTQPTSATVCSGIVQTFIVSATGVGLSYAWSNGQTGPTMSTSIAGSNYTVTVAGICGTKVSTPTALAVNPITQIVTQPQDQVVGPGSVGFFTVSVAGSNTSYLWSNGSTTAIMSTSVAGTYMVTVSGICGTAISNAATLSISSSVITVSAATISGGTLQITVDKGTLQFTAGYFPSNANTNTLVGWSVSPNGIASISGTGLLSALDNGIVTVTGSYGFISASLVVTISGQLFPVTSATISGIGGVNTITTTGGTLQFVSQTSPVFANTNTTASWSVFPTSTASISGTGLLTALNNGLVTVTGTFGTVTGIQVVTISGQIIPVTSATIGGVGGVNTITTLGGSLAMVANYFPLIATNTVPSWSSYPNGVATIDGITGVLTSLSNGTVTVIGAFGSVTAITIITVSGQNLIIPVVSITISGANGNSTITTPGGTLPFTAQISPVNATNTTVSWSVSPNSIATIDGVSGVLTAINDGIVTVTGTVGTIVGISIVTISGQHIVLPPIITFAGIPILTFGGANIFLNAVSSNGQSVRFLTSNVSILGISNATGSINGAGTATITAYVGVLGTSGYAEAVQVVEIKKARQSIVYSPIPVQYIGNPPFQVAVSATSGLLPTLSIPDSSSISLNGFTVNVLGMGVTSLLVQQSGNANYLPAKDVLISVFVADNGSNDLAIFGKDVVPRLNVSNYYISEPDSSKTYEWFYSGSGVTFDTSGANTSIAGIYFQSNATSGNVLVVIYDKNNRVVGVESRAISVFGQTQEDPVGNNLQDPQCLQVVNNCKGSYIQSFEISNIGLINSSQCSPDGFGDFTRINVRTKLTMGNTYSATLTVGPVAFKSGIKYGGLWIDYNNNGSFSDPEDFVLSSFSEDSLLHFKNMLIRSTPDFAGARRLRIRMRASGNFTSAESCPLPNESGETEDYTVFLTPVAKVETPEIITPNGDNLNDYFIIKGMMTDKPSKLTIFDRYGNQKYTNDNYLNEWNGVDQKGSPLKESTYFYVYVNGDITLKGFVEIKY